MSEHIMIAPVEQYIIDQVRRIRNQLGLSGAQLSAKVSSSKSTGLIANIESAAKAATYTDHNLNIIAGIFTELASQIKDAEIQKQYTVYDFYPPAPMDETPIIKDSIKFDPVPGPTMHFNAMVEETDFMDDARSISEITKEINRKFGTTYPVTSMSSTATYAVTKNIVERLFVGEDKVMYRKIKR